MTDLKPYLINAFYTWIIDSKQSASIEFLLKHEKNIYPEVLKNYQPTFLEVDFSMVENLIFSKEYLEFDIKFEDNISSFTIYYQSIKLIMNKEQKYGIEFDGHQYQKIIKKPSLKTIGHDIVREKISNTKSNQLTHILFEMLEKEKLVHHNLIDLDEFRKNK